MATSMQSFVPNSLTTTSSKETFLQDFLVILKRRSVSLVHSNVFVMLNYSTTHQTRVNINIFDSCVIRILNNR